MNKLWLSLILPLAITGTAWSQGTVNFANNVAFTTTANRLVYNVDGVTPLVGSDLSQPATSVAQLFYGANAGSLQAHTAAPARFRPGTSGPGIWLGGMRTLTGFAPGTRFCFWALQFRLCGWRCGGGADTWSNLKSKFVAQLIERNLK